MEEEGGEEKKKEGEKEEGKEENVGGNVEVKAKKAPKPRLTFKAEHLLDKGKGLKALYKEGLAEFGKENLPGNEVKQLSRLMNLVRA